MWITLSAGECADIIQKFKLEGHLDEDITDQLRGLTSHSFSKNIIAREYYKERLNDMSKIEIPLQLDWKKVKIENLEDLLYSGVKNFPPLRNYIKRNKPRTLPSLNEETIDKATIVFVSLAVDLYLKNHL